MAEILCTICARGGSKGVKNKNIRKINELEMIAYSIIQAQNSKLFKHIVISTDSDEIASVAQKYDAEVFFKREAHLANDQAAKLPVMRDALLRSEEHFKTCFETLIDLDASAPLRSSLDIKKAYESFVKNDNSNLITAVPARRNPYFNLVEIQNNKVVKSKEGNFTTRQRAPKCYDMNASIYIFKRDYLLENDSVFGKNTGLFVMLENKIIFVAGACGRIGKALCQKILLSKGIPILADINKERLNKLQENLETNFKTKLLSLELDITKQESLQTALQKSQERYGKIDAFVNSSYPFGKDWGKTPYYELKYEQICESLNLHLAGFMLAAQEFVKFFKQQGYGNIINLSSIMGVYAPKFENYEGTSMQSSLEYSVIKAGINHMSSWLAKELFNQNIRVNTLASGGILDNQNELFLKAYRKCCASKGMLDADDICGTLVFLLSDESKFITGQTLVVDDGWGL